MSDLTSALNRIMAWLEQHSPSSASGFQAGLSSEIIEEKLGQLPFCVSREVYDLYKWRNGDESYSSVFKYLWMLNLDEACEISEDVNHEDLLEMRGQDEPQYLFPLFNFDGEYFAVQGGGTLIDSAPVFHVGTAYDINFAFVSLTGMMLAMAECYESGVYIVNEDGLEVIDKIKFGEIRRKHNPGTVQKLYAEGY
jgi:hypothetical protein